ncbi:MAG: divalent-cation tolerance protein CutA [Armatimonadota bacterium]|nr:divalent-cation tolerance protein CutA [Armatimonadota bacterium]MDR7400930.1 divalent-cation tolerance protein CutA [Armatimonadota bacterium]MDR7404752.1 divalent-cation tolerance protein CutA [Armatimonadota bacterium]MDR7437352.1 divalent-cation tolerance protein CutA [Armatimonadota bacterium]MDR7472832.1 divalent-cation tolerance protein CutA [Armatimonadota bacterium]
MTEHVVVLVTVGDPAEARRIARALVEERLAACVNLIPGLASTYWWQGRVEEAGEVLLVCKTRRDRVEALEQRVRALHSYTVPEVIALPVVAGHPAYLEWVDDSLRPGSASP